MNINSSIFKAYDIRGLYPSELNEASAFAIAQSYAVWLKRANPNARVVAVAGDMRLSTPSLKAQIIQGLRVAGLEVHDFGMLSSPTFYFAVAKYGYSGGIQVSASHNPKDYNGLKIVVSQASPVGKDNGLFEIRDLILNDQHTHEAPELGKLVESSSLPNPIAEAVNYYSEISGVDLEAIRNRHFKIVHDSANSMGSLDFGLEGLFGFLNVELTELNYELDGTFPAHEADPIKPENVADLEDQVKAQKADLGVATDGDADRIFFIDETGNRIPQAIIRGLLSQIELKKHPGKVVCYDLRPGKITHDMILEAGGVPEVTPVGHTFIKQIMEKTGAIFGGESSGHFVYALSLGIFEQPMLVAINLLSWLAEQNRPISELIAPYKKYVESGEINIKVSSQEEVKKAIQKVKEQFQGNIAHEFDGVFVEFPEVWFLVRGSNTEPLLRVSLEASNQQALSTMKDRVMSVIG